MKAPPFSSASCSIQVVEYSADITKQQYHLSEVEPSIDDSLPGTNRATWKKQDQDWGTGTHRKGIWLILLDQAAIIPQMG